MVLNINELLEILNKQKNILKELIDLAEELRLVLINDDLEKIALITGRQEEEGEEMALMEQRRRALLEEYSLQTEAEIKHLNNLYLHIKTDEKEKLQKLANEIKKFHKQLQQIHNRNYLLLKQSMTYTNRILNFLNSGKSGIYSKKGNIKKAVEKGNIDRSI